MRFLELIEKKRDGLSLETAEIQWFIKAVTNKDVPDYQTSALLMAILLQGMSRREIVDLTLAMVNSGDTLDLSDVVPFAIDKHSSGGVGDKTTLVVQPVVAACGVPVAKMSGRGLGMSGGTLDKMESISGWSPDIPMDRFKKQVSEIGLVLAGQTASLAPADGILYALRDVTGTVPSIPLIAGSIMSKKLAAGADAIVLDVKVGSGAFVKTVAAARELAEIMVNIGHDADRRTVALLSDMNQPLGHAIGNALEVKEAVETLNGGGPADFQAHCLEVAGHMLVLAGAYETLDAAKVQVSTVLNDGSALNRFRAMVVAQGGDGAQIDDPGKLPVAAVIRPVLARESGYIEAIDTGRIGYASVFMGAGRMTKGDPLNHAVGMVMPVKIGDAVAVGDELAILHAADEASWQQTADDVLAAFTISPSPVERLPHFYGTIQ